MALNLGGTDKCQRRHRHAEGGVRPQGQGDTPTTPGVPRASRSQRAGRSLPRVPPRGLTLGTRGWQALGLQNVSEFLVSLAPRVAPGIGSSRHPPGPTQAAPGSGVLSSSMWVQGWGLGRAAGGCLCPAGSTMAGDPSSTVCPHCHLALSGVRDQAGGRGCSASP